MKLKKKKKKNINGILHIYNTKVTIFTVKKGVGTSFNNKKIKNCTLAKIHH